MNCQRVERGHGRLVKFLKFQCLLCVVSPICRGGWEKLCCIFLPVVAGMGEAERLDIFLRDRLTPNLVVRDVEDDIFKLNSLQFVQVCRNYEERIHSAAILKIHFVPFGECSGLRTNQKAAFLNVIQRTNRSSRGFWCMDSANVRTFRGTEILSHKCMDRLIKRNS